MAGEVLAERLGDLAIGLVRRVPVDQRGPHAGRCRERISRVPEVVQVQFRDADRLDRLPAGRLASAGTGRVIVRQPAGSFQPGQFAGDY